MDSSDSIDGTEPHREASGDASLDASGDASGDALTTPAHGPIWIVLFVGLVVCTNVAAAGWAAMVRNHPEQLIMLSARNRYLVLAVPAHISPAAWAAIAVARLLVAAIVCHMIGWCYGDRALKWFWRFLGMPKSQVAKFEQQITKAEWVVVPLFIGSNILWALTGAARTSWRRLLPMFAVGAAGRLVLLWWLAHTFQSELQSFIDWTSRYQLWIVLGSVVLVVAANVKNFRGGR
jgi:membrane protein DedA with SNARE-associated domain